MCYYKRLFYVLAPRLYLNMDEQEPLVFGASINNSLFEFPEVLDKNVDNIIVNECDYVPAKPPDR